MYIVKIIKSNLVDITNSPNNYNFSLKLKAEKSVMLTFYDNNITSNISLCKKILILFSQQNSRYQSMVVWSY